MIKRQIAPGEFFVKYDSSGREGVLASGQVLRCIQVLPGRNSFEGSRYIGAGPGGDEHVVRSVDALSLDKATVGHALKAVIQESWHCRTDAVTRFVAGKDNDFVVQGFREGRIRMAKDGSDLVAWDPDRSWFDRMPRVSSESLPDLLAKVAQEIEASAPPQMATSS